MIVWCTQCKTEPFNYPGLSHGHIFICERCARKWEAKRLGPYYAPEYFAPEPRPDPDERMYYSLSRLSKWLAEAWDWRLAPYDSPNIIRGDN